MSSATCAARTTTSCATGGSSRGVPAVRPGAKVPGHVRREPSMARARSRVLAAVLLAAALPLAGCPKPPADCSPGATKSWMKTAAASWYLYASQVDFAAFDPTDPAQSPEAFVTALVDSANAPDQGRHFTFTSTKEATTQLFAAGQSKGY